MLRVIIYHPKEYTKLKRIKRRCRALLNRYRKLMIICNDDRLSQEKIGSSTFVRFMIFGQDAEFKTKCLMARRADALIAYWDGKDTATKQMIAIAQKLELKVKVISI